MKTQTKTIRILTAVLGLMLLLGACTSPKASHTAGDNAASEQTAVGTSFNRLSKSQQIPSFDYSQIRQTLIDVETVQATGAVTTSAGYLEGIGLVWWCPSIGLPVPSTDQLSASGSYVDLPGDGTRTPALVDQGEPTGLYVGQSSGTYTLCLDDNGKKFVKYWEGYVDSTVGVVSSYPSDKRIVITDSTFNFTEKGKK